MNSDLDLEKEYIKYDLEFYKKIISLYMEANKQFIQTDIVLLLLIMFVVILCGVLAVRGFILRRILYGCIETVLVTANVVNGYITTKRLIKNVREYGQYKKNLNFILSLGESEDNSNGNVR